MQTSLNITYADSSLKKSTKSLTYINPEATNAQLETAASLFSAISQNNYVGAERIDRIDVSEPEPTPTVKPDATITATATYNTNVIINYSGEATLLTADYKYITIASGQPTIGYTTSATINNGSSMINYRELANAAGDPTVLPNFNGTLTVYSPETENYAYTTTEITVSSGNI